MASAPKKDGSDAKAAASKRSSPIAFIGAMLVLTGLGVGAGGLLGLQVAGKIEHGSKQAPAPSAPKGKVLQLRALPPVVTNLASPGTAWIRIEASIVAEGEPTADSNALVAEVAEDIVGFMRTVSLKQLEGASGFQHLREDLNERIRIRSGGKFNDLVIHTLLIE